MTGSRHSQFAFSLTLLVICSAVEGYGQIIDTTLVAPWTTEAALTAATDAHDGHLLIGGSVAYFNTKPTGSILKLDHDGNLVPGFKSATNRIVRKMETLANGKILCLADDSGSSQKTLMLLNPDGSVDEIFSNYRQTPISDFVIQNTGRIVVCGSFQDYDQKGYRHLARINHDGSVDTTFEVNSTLEGSPERLFTISEDSIVLIMYTAAGRHIHRFHRDGEHKAAVSTTTASTPFILTHDSKLLAAVQVGFFPSIYRLHKFNLDGTMESSFQPFDLKPPLNQIYVKANGNILLCFYNRQFVELKHDGSFISEVDVHLTEPLFFHEDPNHDVIVFGSLFTFNKEVVSGIAKLNSGNVRYPSFAPPLSDARNGPRLKIKPQSSGKIIVSNDEFNTRISGSNRSFIRLNTDGSLDSTFQPAFTEAFRHVFAIDVLQDDRILAGGAYILGEQKGVLGMLAPDGTVDQSFTRTIAFGGSSTVNLVESVNDQIYLFGNFDGVNGQAKKDFAILNMHGEVVGPAINTLAFSCYDLASQSDGKIVMTGRMEIDGAVYNMIRLNADGTFDPTFQTIAYHSDNYAVDLELDEEDRIWIAGGMLKAVRDQAVNGLTRLTRDGEIDPSVQLGVDIVVPHHIKYLPNGYLALLYESSINFLDSAGNRKTTTDNFETGSGFRVMEYLNRTMYIGGKVVLPNHTVTCVVKWI